jgi:hypothetical protein
LPSPPHRAFTGAREDTEIPLLDRYFLSVSTHPNLRTFEKRRWRSDPGVSTY